MATETLTQKQEEIRNQVKEAFGFVPNVIETMIEHNPTVAEFYLTGSGMLGNGTFNEKEHQAVIIAASTFNDCNYCTTAHSALGKQAGISDDDLKAIADQNTPSDERLAALTKATWTIQEKRGWLEESDIQELDQLGVGTTEIYEIIAIIGLKTISNYVNHINKTEIDPQFKG